MLLILWAASTFASQAAPQSDSTPETNRVALVIKFDDATVFTRCISFTETSISGYEVLLRSGLEITARTNGGNAAICAIEGIGCPASDCFCQSPPDYWSYWQRQETGWAFSGEGAGSHAVIQGDMEGWSWGPGLPPPNLAYSDICTTDLTYKTYLPLQIR